MGRRKKTTSERRLSKGTTLRPIVIKAITRLRENGETFSAVMARIIENSPAVKAKVKEIERA